MKSDFEQGDLAAGAGEKKMLDFRLVMSELDQVASTPSPWLVGIQNSKRTRQKIDDFVCCKSTA